MGKQNTSLRSFTELIAWQKARVLRKAVAVLVKTWPTEERFRLTDQIVRASRSVTANIAEGFGRYYERDNQRFCRQAKGSIMETMDHLTVAFDEGYMDVPALKAHWTMCEEALRVLNGYVAYLQRMADGTTSTVAEPAGPYGNLSEGACFTHAPTDLELDEAHDDVAHP